MNSVPSEDAKEVVMDNSFKRRLDHGTLYNSMIPWLDTCGRALAVGEAINVTSSAGGEHLKL